MFVSQSHFDCFERFGYGYFCTLRTLIGHRHRVVMSKIRWQPLEANPEVMTKYSNEIGMSAGWEFVDVLSLEPELLCMVPQNCCALILLFPITKKYEEYCTEEKARIDKEPQVVSPSIYFMKQTIGNACGTIGLIHSIGNNQHKPEFVQEGSVLHSLFQATNQLSPEKRGAYLESDGEMSKAHQTSAREGQSREISADEKLDLHFVAIVNVDGNLYELDGRKPYPVVHGKCEEGNFLESAAKVCKEFMMRDPQETRFSIVALAPKQKPIG